MSKRAGPTRIPVFGPRIPVPVPVNEKINERRIVPPSSEQNPHQQQQHATTATTTIIPPPTPTTTAAIDRQHSGGDEVTSSDVGKKVRVADKEGTLRFVGNVHFATGLWCGVELSGAVGKNDGSVRGVRYFACPASRGLMVPLSKVSLVDEIAEDAASGPYSMIFDTNDQQLVGNNNNNNNSVKVKHNLGATFTENDARTRRETFTKTADSSLIRHDATYALNEDDEKECDGSSDCNETILRTENCRTFDAKSDVETCLNNTVVFIKEATSNKHKTPSDLNLSNCCNETVILKNINETFNRPKSYPLTEKFFAPIKGSTPVPEREAAVLGRSLILSPIIDDCNNKRDSLDCEESLGILTPDQMVDFSCFTTASKFSSENIPSLLSDVMKYQKETADTATSNVVVDSSLKDYSLGLIDVNEMSTLLSDTTMNMELPLDPDNNNKKSFTLTRIDQTPSPEELPLDPTPISVMMEGSSVIELKTEPTQSTKSTSNFITSITSITSIDTGYQGDGEMSRPASRGPDNSPLTRRPLARPQARRPDPMTDSDFYTESDADNHEEHPLRGDRRAQVIDGTLYGVDPQAAADIYVNNRENMDSSGIFTDLESNMRTEELSSADNDVKPPIQSLDVSPSDSSTKTISDNSQNNVLVASAKTTPASVQSPDSKNVSDSTVKEISPKRHTPSPSTVTSSPTSVRSPRHGSKEEGLKKYKMPKRNVASKVKAMLESSTVEKKAPTKKPVGRWDAVMNKIAKNQEQSKSVVKEIKSKAFTSITTTITTKIETTKTTISPAPSQKTPNNKLRRVRSRATTNNNTATPTKKTTAANVESSIHSSLSDLSNASPLKKIGSAKKQREVTRVTQILTPAKFSPKPNNRNSNEVKKTSVPPIPNDVKIANRKNLFASKDKKKETPIKECSRTTTKGGRVSPGTRPPQQQRAPIKAPPRTAEALAILVQHLVFNLEAFSVPSLKKEVEKLRSDAEEARLSILQLEQRLSDERERHSSIVEEENAEHKAEIVALLEDHRSTIAELKHQHEERLREECQDVEKRLTKAHEQQLHNLSLEYNKLQRTHAETLVILREENDAIREEIDDKNSLIEKLKRYKFESEKLKKDYEVKELSYKEQLRIAHERLATQDDLLHYSKGDGQSSIQEVQSLRAVLELKTSEVTKLRKNLAEARVKAEQLPIAEEKIASLAAKIEDLESQLECKNAVEQKMVLEKSKLEDSYTEAVKQNRRLQLRNEELQWKVHQSREILNRLCDKTTEESGCNRSIMSASLNEHILSIRPILERSPFSRENVANNSGDNTTAFTPRRTKNSSNDSDTGIDLSPPSSPKVKAVVEKSDSVSYVLEMDENPDVAASRILRRSFRNSTPPKNNTPTKSPTPSKSSKQQKSNNHPLSLSASASSVVPAVAKMDHMRSRSISVRNGDADDSSVGQSFDVFVWQAREGSSTPKCNKSEAAQGANIPCEYNLDLDEEHDLEIQLPSLPSEMDNRNGLQALPVPRHLAGEAMSSENNSDDEGTASSSSSGRL